MQRKQIQRRAAFALTLAVALLTSVAPLSRPAEAFGGVAVHGSATSAVTVSAIDPASVQPGPGTVSPSSVNPGNPTGGTPQTAATTTPAAAGTMKSDDKFQPETAPNGKRARAGSLIVTFRSGIEASARDDASHQVGAQAVEPINHTRAVRVQVEPGKLAEAMSAYATRPDVERVEPDYLLYAHMTPGDPQYGQEWGLPRIGAPAAWDRVAGGSGVRVAVLDTGVANHPDLSGRVILAQDFTGSPYGSADRHGHGTHVAGTIAANANNGIGVVGVAYGANLLVGKVLGDGGSGSFSSVANGIIWAADNGAKVISMSLGANLDCPSVIQDAVSYAWTRGAVIVAAAGNDGMSDAHTPGNCANVVPVGAVNSTDGRPAFSNYGPSVPIAAPGDMILSTGKDGDYVWMSGT
jgi:thermitase